MRTARFGLSLVVLFLVGGCATAEPQDTGGSLTFGPVDSFDVWTKRDGIDPSDPQPVSSSNFLVKGRQEGYYLEGWQPLDESRKSWIHFDASRDGFPADLHEQLRDGCKLFGGFKIENVTGKRARISVVYPNEYRDTFVLSINRVMVAEKDDGALAVSSSVGEGHWQRAWQLQFDPAAENVIEIVANSPDSGVLRRRFVLGPRSFAVGGE